MSTSGVTSFTLTANQIVEQAFHILGKASEGEAMTPRMYEDGRSSLNLMLKTWGAKEKLWLKTEATLTLVADQAAYALSPVPMAVESVRRRQSSVTDIPLLKMSRQEYFDMPNKTSSPGTPNAWYFDKQRSTGTLYLWPAPASGVIATNEIRYTYARRLEDIVSSGDEADVPQEWLETLAWNLANRLETKYPVNDARLALKIERTAGQLLSDLESWDTETASIYIQPEYDPWVG